MLTVQTRLTLCAMCRLLRMLNYELDYADVKVRLWACAEMRPRMQVCNIPGAWQGGKCLRGFS